MPSAPTHNQPVAPSVELWEGHACEFRLGETSRLQPSEQMPPLSQADQLTLDDLFSLPLSRNVGWLAIVSLCAALGNVEERPNGDFAFQLRDEEHVMAEPRGRPLAPDEVMDFCALITRAAFAPDMCSQPMAARDASGSGDSR